MPGRLRRRPGRRPKKEHRTVIKAMRKIAKEVGAQNFSTHHRGNGHLAATCDVNGRRVQCFFPSSDSCSRGAKNSLAQFKRLIREAQTDD